MKGPQWRVLLSTLGSVVVALIAALVGAKAVDSVLIGAVCNTVVLQIVLIDQRETEIANLGRDLKFALAIRDSRFARQIHQLVGGLDKVVERNYPLFGSWASENLARWATDLRELSDGHLQITDAVEIQERGRILLEGLQSRLFATSYVQMTDFWTAEKGPAYQQANVHLASRRDISITRVFIFSHRRDMFDPAFGEILRTLRQQLDAGIDVLVAFIDEIPEPARRDFGIWDDSMVCYLTSNSQDWSRVEVADYYVDEIRLHEAQRLEALVRGAARNLADVLPESELNRSAPIMKAISTDLCLGTKETESCAWYHSSWQVLRLLDMVETPQTHNLFFSQYLHKLSEESVGLSILVCGLADYEMVRLVIQALSHEKQGAQEKHHVRVIDTCETPLRITQWYVDQVVGARSPCRVVTTVASAEDTRLPSQSFDLILTDAFLSKIPFPQQVGIIQEWNRILKPGGEVLTTIKLSDSQDPPPVRADLAQIARYVKSAVAQATALQDVLAFSPEEVRGLAEGYAEANISYPVTRSRIASGLFLGFDVEIVGEITVEEYTLSKYAQVIASKPS